MIARDEQTLRHILSHCQDVQQFIQRFGSDYDTFIHDRAYYNAVAMCVMQIGELSNGLSDEFRESTKDQMPWGMIRGMRNWLAHSYSEIDSKVLWETARNDLPKVLSFCQNQFNH
ncbi:MAG: DUF86 domain-containing protein [Clostridia bacterium]|nr:DUF86 domain-containing protein [Clostridia bacterium]